MAAVIKLVQGDDLPGITFVVRDSQKAAAGQELDRRDPSTWAVVNLADCAVFALVSKVGSFTALESVDCFVSNAVSGEVLIVVKDCSFLDTVGEYQVEVSVKFPEGRQTVYDMIQLDVRERIKDAT
ncbi:MAG: hypothetical protein ACRCVV_12510 [Shewanella sp.]